VGVALLVLGAIFWAAYAMAERVGVRALREATAPPPPPPTAHRMDLYSASLLAEMNRFELLPPIVALNEQVLHLLTHPQDKDSLQAVNLYLQRVNARSGASAIYVMDMQGLTLAASNWNQPVSFMNMNFAYRPYFQDAARGVPGRFYGIGTVSREPGYYFSQPVQRAGLVIGVVAVKLSLEKLDQAWGHEGERIALADGNGVVFLTSEHNWKYRTLQSLSPETMGRLEATRQYTEAGLLSPLGMQQLRSLEGGSSIVRVVSEPIELRSPGSAADFLVHESRVLGTDWRLLVLSELGPTRNTALISAALAALSCGLLLLLAMYFQQRRRSAAQTIAARRSLEQANDVLEHKVALRTEALSDANSQLQAEIAERHRAEEALRVAFADLAHTGKMAALGQMSAGITHELNQPLAALRTLSSNAVVFMKRGDMALAQGNLEMIGRVTQHMGKITAQLRKFARKAPAELHSVVVACVVDDAIFLLSQGSRQRQIPIAQRIVPAELQALCDPNRLEQVLLNLLANALDAVEELADPKVLLVVERDGDWVSITVHDNGPGISEAVQPRLFEPFQSTKAQGVGLGLGLAISADIVKDLGGSIRACRSAELGGAGFCVLLKATQTEVSHA
jgi:two-component system C4-dicarboxylate transport sensor histidine kinase DctB